MKKLIYLAVLCVGFMLTFSPNAYSMDLDPVPVADYNTDTADPGAGVMAAAEQFTGDYSKLNAQIILAVWPPSVPTVIGLDGFGIITAMAGGGSDSETADKNCMAGCNSSDPAIPDKQSWQV